MIRGLDGVLQRIQELERSLSKGAAPQAAAPSQSPDFPSALNQALGPGQTPASGNASYDGLIQAAASKYGVDQKLVRSVIRAESDFDPRCVSSAGAKGLMQLMPENCRELNVSDPFDPAQNIDAGVRQLKQMLDGFGRTDLALAAYNAGPGAVRRYGGIPPYRETQAYVSRVMGWLNEE